MYSAFKEGSPVKASREIASLSERINLLSLKELGLLSPKDLKGYTADLSKAMAKASLLNGSFKTTKKISFRIKLIEEAYASVRCPVQGLYPAQKNEQADCNTQTRGILISEDQVSKFNSDHIRASDNALRCPDGQSMCNPAMIGFDFSEAKPQLRCLEDASNEKCFDEFKPTGEDMKKSLELLKEASPSFWTEFEAGINELCITDGVFNENEEDDGCDYVRKQMNHSTLRYRSKLTREYTDLAKKIQDATERAAALAKACRRFQASSQNGRSLGNHENFNEHGQKIVISQGRCWRLPANTKVEESNGRYVFSQPGGTSRILTLDKHDSVRFHNFRCGPCNGAVSVTACIAEQEKDLNDRATITSRSSQELVPSMDDCLDYITNFETVELPQVVFDKASDQGQSFYQMQSIN